MNEKKMMLQSIVFHLNDLILFHLNLVEIKCEY